MTSFRIALFFLASLLSIGAQAQPLSREYVYLNGRLIAIEGGSAPTGVSASAGTPSGQAQPFTFVFSDANGAADIVNAHVILDTAPAGQTGCNFRYTVSDAGATTRIYLWQPENQQWVSSNLPLTGTLQNTKCSITSGSIALSGTTLTEQITVTPKAGFSGTQTIFLAAQDAGGFDSGLQTHGTWVIGGASTYPVSGRVVSGASGVTGVTITLGGQSTLTTATGDYSFGSIAPGSYTAIPTLTGYIFDPVDRPVTVTSQAVVVPDFTATPVYTVTGRVVTGGGSGIQNANVGINTTPLDQHSPTAQVTTQ